MPIRPDKRRAPAGAPFAFLLAACEYEGDECLIWPYGTSSNGYGRIRIGDETVYVHREVLVRTKGPAPRPGMEGAHAPEICHNPLCCNKRHLRWATTAENAADRVPDDTHRRGERNTFARLRPDQVLAIRADPRPPEIVAPEFGTHVSTVFHIRARKKGYWAWL